jgi:hypothetical protein
MKTRFAGLFIEKEAALRKRFLPQVQLAGKKKRFLRERFFEPRNEFRGQNDFNSVRVCGRELCEAAEWKK